MRLASLSTLAREPVSHNAAISKRVFVRAGQAPPILQFAESVIPPGEVAPGHAHADMTEVFLVTGGRGTATVDGRAYPLGVGDCIVVEPGEVHEMANTGSEPWVLVYFGVQCAPLTR